MKWALTTMARVFLIQTICGHRGTEKNPLIGQKAIHLDDRNYVGSDSAS